VRHVARRVLEILRFEYDFSWFLKQTLLHVLFAELDVSCNAPDVHTSIVQHTPTVGQSTGYSLDACIHNCTLFTPIEELNLFE
jgi:hypothetical protein